MGPALDELNLDPKDFGPLLISQKFKWPQEKILKWLTWVSDMLILMEQNHQAERGIPKCLCCNDQSFYKEWCPSSFVPASES